MHSALRCSCNRRGTRVSVVAARYLDAIMGIMALNEVSSMKHLVEAEFSDFFFPEACAGGRKTFVRNALAKGKLEFGATKQKCDDWSDAQ